MSDVDAAPLPTPGSLRRMLFLYLVASLSSFDPTRRDGFGRPARLQRPPTHTDEPESIVLSDLFIPQVGTPRLREGTHFLVGRWAGHAINFLKELLFFFFKAKSSRESKIKVMGRTLV